MAHIDESPPEPRVLLVEGQNDKHVVLHICRLCPELPDFLIRDRGGIDQLIESVGAELSATGLRTLGILVDTDTDRTDRWNAIRGRLASEGITLPRDPKTLGEVIDTPSKPRVGAWLMPDNATPGELEDFVARMIPPNDPVWPRSQQYIDQIPPADRKFSQNKITRAQVHAWLAAREQPRQMGLAIHARDLEISGPLCQDFVSWIRQLFS